MKKIEEIVNKYKEAKDDFEAKLKNKAGICIAAPYFDDRENRIWLHMSGLTIEEAILLRDWLNEMLKETK